MTIEEIVDVLCESEGERIHCIETDGDEWTGTVCVFESASDNEGDEVPGASICVKRDDGFNALVYEGEIEFVEIIQDDENDD